MKTLKMVFQTAAGKAMSLSLKDPKDELDLETVRAAAEKMIPAMASGTGDVAESFKQASVIETNEVILQ